MKEVVLKPLKERKDSSQAALKKKSLPADDNAWGRAHGHTSAGDAHS